MPGFIGELLTGAPPPGQAPATAGPPQGAPPKETDPALEQNKGLWRGFFSRMKSDPNFRQGVMQVGLGMMRSQQPGENAGDVIGQALGSGVATIDMLRQRDKAQSDAEAERRRKAELDTRQETREDKQTALQGETVQIARDREAREGLEHKDSVKAAEDALAEAKRQGVSKDKLAWFEAQTERMRAEAYSKAGGAGGGGRTPQEIQKIENLTAEKIQNGEDPVAARAAATREVITTSRTGSLLDNVDSIVKERAEQYIFSEDARTKPMTMEMMNQWRREAIEQVRNDVASLKQGATTPPPVVRPGQAVSGTPAITPPVARTPPDPEIAKHVKAALDRGIDPGQIRLRIQQMGGDPAAYNLEQ